MVIRLSSIAYTDVIDLIISFVNSNYNFKNNLRLNYDELKLDKDSIMITNQSNDTGSEKRDITGLFADGAIDVAIYYRIMNNDSGNDDLKSIKLINDLVNFIELNYKQIKNDSIYLSKISNISSATLASQYDNNVKDFCGKFRINYFRRL